MYLNVYNTAMQRIGIVFSWVSLIWIPRYNTSGVMQIETRLTDDNLNIFKVNNFVMCDEDGTNTVMLITSVHKTEDNRIIVNGFDATFLLNRRATADSRPSTYAENSIRTYVQNIAAIPNFQLGSSAGITTRYQGEIVGGTVLDVVQKIAGAADIGMRVSKRNSMLEFECYKPTVNKNIVYATKYGNLISSEYTKNISAYGNVALVKAKDENEAVFTFTVGDTAATGTDRYEMFVDLTAETIDDGESPADFRNRLEGYAWQRLSEVSGTETVNFEIDDDRCELGDIVTVILDYQNMVVNTRITGLGFQNQDGATTKLAEVGLPIRRR